MAMIYDSGRYFEMIFAVITVHIAKDSSLVAWSRVRFVGQKMI